MTFDELPKYCINRPYCEDEPICKHKALCTRFVKKTGITPSEYQRRLNIHNKKQGKEE